MKRRETGEVVYRNSRVTDKPVTEENIGHMASCGRTRWKIENEHNNVLKNRGCNLRHNFRVQEAACVTIPELGDGDFRDTRNYAGRRDMFFYEMLAALRYVLHETRRDFLLFITAGEDLE
jgi:hypothetical protein